MKTTENVTITTATIDAAAEELAARIVQHIDLLHDPETPAMESETTDAYLRGMNDMLFLILSGGYTHEIPADLYDRISAVTSSAWSTTMFDPIW